MEKINFISELKRYKEIICACEFGSYRTKDWIKNRSDIDLAVVTAPGVSFLDTMNIEDEIKALAIEYYNYEDIHLTFILFKDFYSKFARIVVDSNIKFVVDENKWYDFMHYVCKAARNNEKLERTLKIDEQYTYFGGIIDESLL